MVPAPDFRALEREQCERLGLVRAGRAAAAVAEALASIRAIAPAYREVGSVPPPLMPAIIAAVRARASVGEIADVLREVWGEYRPG